RVPRLRRAARRGRRVLPRRRARGRDPAAAGSRRSAGGDPVRAVPGRGRPGRTALGLRAARRLRRGL
ncbi:MAG: hypothetical protein AVDCRST_MAG79-2177, partial [uncultured Thermoleophilia bacterium]